MCLGHNSRRLALSLATLVLIFGPVSTRSEDVASALRSTQPIRSEFQNPPKAYRPMVRWWWPGNDVKNTELRREVAELDRAGFGGAEIQSMFMNFGANLPDDQRARLYEFGTSSFFNHLRTVVDETRSRGMWIDLTFTSGWPYGGGDAVTPKRAVTELLYSEAAAAGSARFHQKLNLPVLGSSPIGSFVHMMLGDPIQSNPPGWDERLKGRARTIAVLAFRAQAPQIESATNRTLAGTPNIKESGRIDLSSKVDLNDKIGADGTLDWQPPPGDWRIFVFRQVAMEDRVVGGAWPGPELILDHFSKAAFDAYAARLGAPLISALSGRLGDGLRALFCDSLEIPADLYWSDDFLTQFQKRRGYNLVPYLPLIIQYGYNNGYSAGETKPLYDSPETGPAVRRDYWKTVSELITERFYEPLVDWSSAHHLLARIQAHGAPADLLRVYGLAGIPETEQLFADGIFDFLKMASSAADIYGRKIVSSESMESSGDSYLTTPETLKENADKLIVAGVNEIVYHGYPYVYDDRPYPGWSPFNTGTPVSFASFMNGRNTFWPYIGRVNAYITRLQYMSQTGKAVNPVAVLTTRIGYAPSKHENPPITKVLAEAGYGFDHINFDSITSGRIENGEFVTVGGARFRAIVIDDASWLDLAAAKTLVKAVQQGLAVIFVGRLPTESEGYKDYAADSDNVREAVQAITSSPRSRHVGAIDDLIPALNTLISPNVRFRDGHALPFIEKKVGPLDTFFFRNPEAGDVKAQIEVSASGSPELWDPWTGEITPYENFQTNGKSNIVVLVLPSHGSALLVFDPSDQREPTGELEAGPSTELPVSGPWDFHAAGHVISGSGATFSLELPQLIDWAKDQQLKGFSGRATYVTHINIPPESIEKAKRISLNLGEVRDVAEVAINGTRAAVLLIGPYTADITKLVHPGVNVVEIAVVNALSNAATPRPPVIPNIPLNMQTAKSFVPRSSGLIGPVSIKMTY